ncbi:hypothetical protein HIM_03602 [Hirsutella minnesotensis 3608]|uniref:PLAT domain-containing protein n=1 Tax=Hirsutella minnesotensis 3608 TaxID=1043627 RepID=A0A0F7ZMI9_9HYPO|nr:hypothetical protein HIM_03602 [Hirsutella minnesotensis 3608]
MLLVPAIFGLAALATHEQVPYKDGLSRGQGFNTYTQTGCMHNAVDITEPIKSDNASPDQVEVTYAAEKIVEYQKLIQSLDISASATMSEASTGGEGGAKARFLDQSEFESSFLTYLVKVDVRRQPSSSSKYAFKWIKPRNPHRAYCNRFISGKGGALFARVSIITKDASKHREVEQSAEVAFSVFGINTKVTDSIKSSFEEIQKHSEVRVFLHYVGAPPEYKDKISAGHNDELLQLKETADRFLAEAQRHEWRRFALLEKYDNLAQFNSSFEPLDYAEASDRSWSVFGDFTEYLGIQKLIRQVPSTQYSGGRVTRDRLDRRASDIIAGYRRWVARVARRPQFAKQRPAYSHPAVFREQILLAIRPNKYIVQRLSLGKDGSTDIIDKTLRPGAAKLFEIRAYDKPGVPGTVNLMFVKKRGEDKFTCLMGRSVTPGYEMLSQLWVFDAPVHAVGNETVEVVTRPRMGSIELVPRHDEASMRRRLARRAPQVSLWSNGPGKSRAAAGLFAFYIRSA